MKNAILISPLIAFFLLITTISSSFAQSNKTIERAGDILQLTIPLTAYGMTFMVDDHAGRRGFSKTFFSTMSATYALKYAIPKERPDGGGQSFVSGHTSAAFSGAAFIQRRYGWKYGIPAYLCASFVGWSRVKARKHDSDDVFRGAAIGLLSSYVFTKPYNETIRISPFVGDRKFGLAFQFLW